MPRRQLSIPAHIGRFLLVVFWLCLLAGTAWAGEDQAIQARAQGWLELLGRGQYAAAYAQCAPFLQKSVTPKEWDRLMRELAAKTGPAQGRKLVRGQEVKDLPGAPKGDYYLLLYSPGFAKLPQLLEQVALVKGDDGQWRVVGYYLR